MIPYARSVRRDEPIAGVIAVTFAGSRIVFATRSFSPAGEIFDRAMDVASPKTSVEPPAVVFLDDNDDLRAVVPELVKLELGVECLSFARLTELEEHAEEVLRARVAILDVNLGPNEPDGVEAFHWLVAHGFKGKVLFFTGHARANPRVTLAAESGVEVLEKPLDPDTLMARIAHALNGKS